MPVSAKTAVSLALWLLLFGVAPPTVAAEPEIPSSGSSIRFIPGPQHRRDRARADEDAGIETVYGQLARRRGGHHHHPAAAAAADVGPEQSPNNATLASIQLLGGRAEPGEPGEDTYGKLVHVPGCFICPQPDVASLSGRALLNSLATMKMKSYMRARAGDLHNKCVFYTASLRKPQIPFLSEEASRWACRNNKYSIWHLWPNKKMAQDSPNRYQDFYGLYERDNWLNSIDSIPTTRSSVPPPIVYFENMSEAMAQSCSGEVVIMSMSTDDMKRYIDGPPNIWRNKERPALLALKRQGKISRFLLVDYDSPQRVYTFDIETNERGRLHLDPLESRSLDGLHLDEGLRKRDCGSQSDGLAQMPPMGDPFADDYSVFAKEN
ncbi:hypothetical protein RB595_004754 [Gaeumannomyces hyphopodioides]